MMRHEWKDGVVAALALRDEEERLRAAREAYLYERFIGVLMVHLAPALEAESITCTDCPAPHQPEARTVHWDTFAAYVGAHAWPDPVVTPRDDRGRPTGEPKYSMHVCVGINGIEEIPQPDPALRELGFLAAFHTELFLDRAPKLYAEIRKEPAFLRLKSDDERTRWLRDQLGPRLAADPEIRQAICETTQRLRPETGITLEPCDPLPAPSP
jgi:hypothetical protein